jgi:enamine deaminase RidA (YjgF/YER057c/UK114 family)
MRIEARLAELGLELPAPIVLPPGMRLPFSWVRICGNRAYVSGHGPLLADGTPCGPYGKVGDQVTPEQAYTSARLTALSMLSSLQRELGDLDRIAGWLRVFGMVNSAPGFSAQPAVINGFSDLIIEIFGPTVGQHARSAVGMAGLPLDLPVEIEAELEIIP